MTELQLCEYTRDERKCTQMAEVFCQVGTCAPGTHYCLYHYTQSHLPEDERDEIDLVFNPSLQEEEERVPIAPFYREGIISSSAEAEFAGDDYYDEIRLRKEQEALEPEADLSGYEAIESENE